jgi:hypothetical protein
MEKRRRSSPVILPRQPRLDRLVRVIGPVLRKLSPAAIWHHTGNRPITLSYSAWASPIASRE